MLWTMLVIVVILWLLGFIGGFGGQSDSHPDRRGSHYLDRQPALWPTLDLALLCLAPARNSFCFGDCRSAV
jgi:hypothetical protein